MCFASITLFQLWSMVYDLWSSSLNTMSTNFHIDHNDDDEACAFELTLPILPTYEYDHFYVYDWIV